MLAGDFPSSMLEWKSLLKIVDLALLRRNDFTLVSDPDWGPR
jgi:hypothetical protein